MSDTTPRDQLARIISDAENCTDEEGSWALPEDVADAILAAGFRPPARTVTTVEELDALEDGAVVLDAEDYVTRVLDGEFCLVGWTVEAFSSEEIAIPATVVYEPEEGEG